MQVHWYEKYLAAWLKKQGIKFTINFTQRKSILLVIWFDITYTKPPSPTAHTGVKIPQIYQYILTPSQNCFVIIVAISINLKWIKNYSLLVVEYLSNYMHDCTLKVQKDRRNHQDFILHLKRTLNGVCDWNNWFWNLRLLPKKMK